MSVKRVNRCIAPFYVQFELTNKCNNKCFFCYNEIAKVKDKELSLAEIKRILSEMAELGVFKINFNGGEPLTRPDFFEIAEYAHSLGLQLHMNTNATLITPKIAKKISKLMPSVCVSMLSNIPHIHDSMSGRAGAFAEVLRGMRYLKEENVKIEVNVCTTSENYQHLYDIAKIAAANGCNVICSTRYILSDISQVDLVLNSQKTVELIHTLLRIKDIPGIDAVSLPGPVPFCELPSTEWDALKQINVPCQFGYGLCRVTPSGTITPCPISDDITGDLKESSFKECWQDNRWEKYEKLNHIPSNCRDCSEFNACKAGCIVYDQCLLNSGIRPSTLKWR